MCDTFRELMLLLMAHHRRNLGSRDCLLLLKLQKIGNFENLTFSWINIINNLNYTALNYTVKWIVDSPKPSVVPGKVACPRLVS